MTLEQIEHHGKVYEVVNPQETSRHQGTLNGVIFVPEKLIKRMERMARMLDAEYISGMTSSQEDKPQYKNQHKSYKQKGGSRSPAIKLIEVVIDFKSDVSTGNYAEALTNYYYLKRALSI